MEDQRIDELNENEVLKENDNEAKIFANEFLKEASKNDEFKPDESTKTSEEEQRESELLEGIELSEILNLLPPDFIQSLVSPTSFILKQKYSKDFDKDTISQIESIIKDSDSILAIKKRCLEKILEDYCKEKGISPDKVKISPLWVYLALEFFTFKQKFDALEGLKKEMLVLRGEAKL